MNTNDFKNFVVLSANVRVGIGRKVSKEGRKYAVAEAEAVLGKESVTLRVTAFDALSAVITPGPCVLIGRLAYQEFQGEGEYVLYPEKIEEPPENGKLKNYAILTVRAAADADTQYSAAGKMWSRVRAFMSMGKEKDGQTYKPSLWMTVKGFESRDGNQAIPIDLGRIDKGELFTVKGNLDYHTYQGRGYLELIAREVEAPEPKEPEYLEDPIDEVAPEDVCPF